MEFYCSAASVISGTATATANYANQVFIHKQLFIVFEIVGQDAAIRSKNLLSALEKQIVKSPPTAAAFKQLLKSQFSDHIAYTAGLISDYTLYVVVASRGVVYLKRENTLAVILNRPGSASGELKIGDRILLGSNQFAAAITQKEIITILNMRDVKESAAALTTRLEARTSNTPAAAAIIAISQGVPLVTYKTIDNRSRFKVRLNQKLMVLKKLQLTFKPLLITIGVLLVLLLLSVGFGISKKQHDKENQQLKTVLESVTHEFDEGMALIDLNPIRSRQLLNQAQSQLEAARNQITDSKERRQLDDFLKKVNTGIAAAQRSYEVVLTSFFELPLIKPNAEGTRISLYQDVLVILDNQNKSLYRLSITSKASRVLAGGEIVAGALAPAVHGEEVYLFNNGIGKITGTEVTTIIPPDPDWGTIVDLKAFGGNLYILDTRKNWIWKYIRTETGFSSKQDYFVFDTLVDLSEATNFAIDGSVWITQGDKIRHFTSGKEDVWQIQGLNPNLGNHTRVYVDDTTTNTYILDADNRRVVVVDKSGVYLAQYHWKESIEITDFVVSEVVKKILLLSHGTIYAIDIK